MKTVDLTLKAYVELFVSRWEGRPIHPYRGALLAFLKAHRSQWWGCELSADELLSYLWWLCRCDERRHIIRLANSYRQYCVRHGLSRESITFTFYK